jgi:hypothetical protein
MERCGKRGTYLDTGDLCPKQTRRVQTPKGIYPSSTTLSTLGRDRGLPVTTESGLRSSIRTRMPVPQRDKIG